LAAIEDYISDLERELATRLATEHTHRPALKRLLESIGPPVTAVNEPKRVECGAPDFTVLTAAGTEPLTVGYVEAKDIGTLLKTEEGTEQLKRYRNALGNLVLTDHLSFRWYVDGSLRAEAVLGDLSGTKVVPRDDGERSLETLLVAFLSHAPEKIKSPAQLATSMARLTHLIRDMVVAALETKSAAPTTVELRNAFNEVLLPDISDAEFADMFAQTLAYGLFAARTNHQGDQPFTRAVAASEIPQTNPFLRRLFATVAGPELDTEPYAGLVDDLTQLLAFTDVDAVLRNFGTRTRRADPVIHFYETFLQAYDAQLRELRGVYFTPEPVVSYIVASVDEVLRERFECPTGLGDTAATAYPPEEDDSGRDSGPRVLILDPACGTGTFLYAVVDRIREQFIAQGDAGTWAAFVEDQLLPRLFGFELLMAPYAVAHLKLALQLAARDLPEDKRPLWAYNLHTKERLGVYLTNTLEEAAKKSELLLGSYISDEANAAADVKRRLPIMVVLGNPPYSGHSANRSEVTRMKTVGKTKPRRVAVVEKTFIGNLVDDYYRLDGEPLGERTTKWLQDDYVKFLRFGQWRIERTGAGVLAFITNHGYLDNPTFRGMRRSLMGAFSEIYLLDLHGNLRKREKTESGEPDKNVFDIEQGVAIGIFVRREDADHAELAKVFHADLWGQREEKYEWLSEHSINTTPWEQLNPTAPYYLFRPQTVELRAEYESLWRLDNAMPVHGAGMTTARNHVVVDFDEAPLVERARIFRDSTKSDAAVLRELKIKKKKGWDEKKARQLLRDDGGDLKRFVQPLNHLPFDHRLILYHDALVWRTVKKVMLHMLRGGNLALLTTRQTRDKWDVLVTDRVITHKALAAYDITTMFPLYLYPEPAGDEHGRLELGEQRTVNFAPNFTAEVAQVVGLSYIGDAPGDLRATFGAEDLFAYIYGVLQSPGYRERYAEFLIREFPRVPLTHNNEQFAECVSLGKTLLALHLLESLSNRAITFPVPGVSIVGSHFPEYVPLETEAPDGSVAEAGRVYINQTQFFLGVSEEAWNLWIGGYQPAQKWLKERMGRKLTFDDLGHYERLIGALEGTIAMASRLDDALPVWPLGA
jgi:hypothetical protein